MVQTISKRTNKRTVPDSQDWLVEVSGESLRMERADELPQGVNSLAWHADWQGPVKLCRGTGGLVRRAEFCVGKLLQPKEPLFETAAGIDSGQVQDVSLRDRLIEFGRSLGALGEPTDWRPPAAAEIARLLAEMGYEAATDQDDNLRMTLKCPKTADGQVRIERGPGRLRMTMLLGRWPTLDAAPRSAMLRLAEEFNARVRMTRIAWIEDADQERVEAQVNLSGIPYLPDHQADTRQQQQLWSELLRAGAGGLQLAQRQLTAELDALADQAHGELVELLL